MDGSSVDQPAIGIRDACHSQRPCNSEPIGRSRYRYASDRLAGGERR